MLPNKNKLQLGGVDLYLEDNLVNTGWMKIVH